jgi:hypothetical protein
MNISDLAGLSEPLTRLIEVVSKGVGSVFAPYLIRKTAEARAHEIRTIANALKDVGAQAGLPVVYDAGQIRVWQEPEDATLRLEPVPEDRRLASRLNYQERKRQNNIECVTAEAAANLVNENAIPEERPDEDWVNRFFAFAQDISSEEMQVLWGRILAGEIKKPGSYSMRTLDFVRNLTKKDASVFEHVAKLALTIPGGIPIIAVHDQKWLESSRGVLPAEHFLLSELGLMYPNDLEFRAFLSETEQEQALFGQDHLLLIKRGKIQAEARLKIWKLTDIGRELLPLIERPMDEEYLEKIGRFFISRGGEAIIAKITAKLPDGKVSYDIMREMNVDQGAAPNAHPPVG